MTYQEYLELFSKKVSDLKLKSKVLRHPLLSFSAVSSLIVIIYWGLWASDRYVSEAHVMIQSTDIVSSQGMDFSSLLGGMGVGGGNTDQLILRDHLLSVDMVKKLDEKLNLREHYSDFSWDLFSRMWDKDTSIEWFHKYYLSRVSIELDSLSGVLVIKAEAFTPQETLAITSMLVKSGELFMNKLARDLAKVQVDFLEDAVVNMSHKALVARQTVLDFQNTKGLVSPENETKNLVGMVNSMDSKLSELQTEKAVMLSYLMPTSPNVIEINMQISAIKKQIVREKAKLTSPTGKTLNKMVEEYERLQMNAEFAQDVYKSAIQSLELGRIDAARTLKKMSILQKPSLPEYPLKPARLYNITVFIICILLISGIISLLVTIINDHQD